MQHCKNIYTSSYEGMTRKLVGAVIGSNSLPTCYFGTFGFKSRESKSQEQLALAQLEAAAPYGEVGSQSVALQCDVLVVYYE